MYLAKHTFVIKYGNKGHTIARIDEPWFSRPYVIQRRGVIIARTFTRYGAERYISKIEHLRGW